MVGLGEGGNLIDSVVSIDHRRDETRQTPRGLLQRLLGEKKESSLKDLISRIWNQSKERMRESTIP